MIIDPSICRPALESWLEDRPAGNVLAVGEGTERVFVHYRQRHHELRLTSVSAHDIRSRMTEIERHDLALIANTLEYLPKAEAGTVIGRLRDVCSERLYVLLPIGDGWEGHVSHWENVDMLGYGLMVAEHYVVDGKTAQLYCHDLYDYKQTPEWLNAKNWANPELWDKFRW